MKSLRRNYTAPTGLEVYQGGNAEQSRAILRPEDPEQEYQLDYRLQVIKSKYFRKTLKRNISQPGQLSRGFSRLGKSRMLDSDNIYQFEINKYEISQNIKECLQKPLTIMPKEIEHQNSLFLKSFPFVHIPIVKLEQMIQKKKIPEVQAYYRDEKKKYSDKEYINIQRQHAKSNSKFNLEDISGLISLIEGPEILKMTGILLHLTYWTMFGQICPAEIDPSQRKQMIVLLVNFFQQIKKTYSVSIAQLFLI